MKTYFAPFILTICLLFSISTEKVNGQNIAFQFYNKTFNITTDSSLYIKFDGPLTEKEIASFYDNLSQTKTESIISLLTEYKAENHLNDWFYYQLIRKTVQQISPKEDNYERYTLYKWYFLAKSGYDTRLAIGDNRKLLFFVWSDEDISDIPFFRVEGKQFVCLNFHDYKDADYLTDKLVAVNIYIAEAKNALSYKVTQIPDFDPQDYKEKLITFNFNQKAYSFNVKLSDDVETAFKNYPGVDYESYFNIPLSRETYSSLIPLLKKSVGKMSKVKGVDYLMRFTRNAFLYETDEDNFGKEKRLSPEQTLFSDYSDCDDRAALFFYLVKEIYNIPMIALLYPTHITIAVKFDKPIGKPILYKGENYYVCEPTPQKKDLKIGELSSNFRNKSFEIVYQYQP